MRRGRLGTRRFGDLPVKAALVAASVLVSLTTIEGLIAFSLRHPDILRSADGMGLRALARISASLATWTMLVAGLGLLVFTARRRV